VKPFATGPALGETIDIWGSIYRFKALGEQTGGAYTLVEVQGRKGFETPLHSHANEEEGFYIVEGIVTLVLGDDLVEAPAGTFGFVPRGLGHGFRLQSDAKMLLLLSPGASGHEGMFREVGEAAPEDAVPAEPWIPNDPERVGEIASRHGTAVLGPLPT
jgi:quercetin dioxygenase-like cupin family protein